MGDGEGPGNRRMVSSSDIKFDMFKIYQRQSIVTCIEIFKSRKDIVCIFQSLVVSRLYRNGIFES